MSTIHFAVFHIISDNTVRCAVFSAIVQSSGEVYEPMAGEKFADFC